MRIGIFTMTVVGLLFLLAFLNSFWIGRLLRPELRKKFRWSYIGLTVLSAAAYLGMRMVGQFDLDGPLSVVFYFGPFWTVLQLLLLLSWPFSQVLASLQRRKGLDPQEKPPSCSGAWVGMPGITRRAFLSQAAMIPPMAMTGVNTLGVVDAEIGVTLRRLDFAYAGLPKELDGLRIAHMTDVHIGPYISTSNVKKMVGLLAEDRPDMLAITGDMVDDVKLLPAALEAIQPFLSSLPLGAWFCMGNHEHIRGAAPIRRILQQYGITILDNRHQPLSFGGGRLFVAGVDYPMNLPAAERRAAAEEYLDLAFQAIPKEEFILLLAHHPDFLPGAFTRKVALTLAGHTHGGQVGWGRRSAFEFIYPYMRGVYQEGSSLGYVSSGAGHWMPFRLNCPPEVSLITLRRKA